MVGPSDISPGAPSMCEVKTMTTDRQLLTPGEVAQLFRVDPKTVTRWASDGKLTCIRTLGGHRRFRAEEVYALLRDESRQA